MARPRAFNEEAVLTGAMHCFRAVGFQNASIKVLEAATGLTSGSLYNTYGDKEGLFRAALKHYLKAVVLPRLADFADARSGLDDLERLYLSIFELPYADGRGCLVTNSAVEFGATLSIASEGVTIGLDAVEAGIRSVMARSLPAEHVDASTMRLVLIYQGLLVLSRAGRAGPEVSAAISDEFRRLRSLAKAEPERKA
jgi:AcrR family transcriptional regulator